MNKKILVYIAVVAALLVAGALFFLSKPDIETARDDNTGLVYMVDDRGEITSRGFESFEKGQDGYLIATLRDTEFILSPQGDVVSSGFDEIRVEGDGYVGVQDGQEYELNEFGSPTEPIDLVEITYEDVLTANPDLLESILGDPTPAEEVEVILDTETDTDVEIESETDVEDDPENEVVE